MSTGGQDGLRVRKVEMVRRCDVDDVHRIVGQERLEGRVGAGHTQLSGTRLAAFRRAPEHAANLDADPAQLLNVDGADEPGADHRGADARALAHALSVTLMPAHTLDPARPYRYASDSSA